MTSSLADLLTSASSWATLALGLCLALYFYLRRNYGVWEKKGLASIPPTVVFGNNFRVLTGQVHINDHQAEVYRKFRGKK